MNEEQTNFVSTLEYRRFAEFCDACRRYRYIGLCYGRSGVGKTLSARQYTRWDEVEACQAFPRAPLPILQALWESDAVFYTPRVVNSPHQIEREIEDSRNNLRFIRWHVIDYDHEAQREELDRRQKEQEEAYQLRRDWRASDAVALSFDPEYRQVNKIRFERQAEHADPARLIVVDEADRLKMASLEPGALWADETSLTGAGSAWC